MFPVPQPGGEVQKQLAQLGREVSDTPKGEALSLTKRIEELVEELYGVNECP